MIRIFDGESECDLSLSDLPIALGITADNTLSIGPQAEADPCLWLRGHDGHYFLQTESGGRSVYQNGKIIKGSVWITATDTIRIGDIRIRVNISGDRLDLRVIAPSVKGDSQNEIGSNSKTQTSSAFPERGATERVSREKLQRWKSKPYIIAVFGILVAGVAFVLSASLVTLDIKPSPTSISLSGIFPAIPFGDRFLVLPGKYKVRSKSPGYRPLDESVRIEFGNSHRFFFQMLKLPGLISIKTAPDIPAEVKFGDKFVGTTPLTDIEISPGTHSVEIRSERYLTVQTSVKVTGKGERQVLNVALDPAWGTLMVTSNPKGADLTLNGRLVGSTPSLAKPLRGKYRLELAKPGWKPAYREFDISPGRAVDLGTIQLERIDGKLFISSRPSNATVTIGDMFRGRTPLKIDLVGQKTYDIRLTKLGYKPKILSAAIKSDKTTTIVAKLNPEFGIIFLKTSPSGAKLKIDGRPVGAASQRLRLQTRPHNIEISKPGYITYRGMVSPRKAASKSLKITLEKQLDVLRQKSRKSINTSSGHVVRIVPIDGEVEFKMGASRRERGRRSNETLYPVGLTKSFAIGEAEVTNAMYRRFRPNHNSGSGLNGDAQPAVSLTWDDAARYLNWISELEGHPPAYHEEKKRMVAILPLTMGYRLPTEAEWVYVARYEAGKRSKSNPLKFPWGFSMPPIARSGNFADQTAAGLVPIQIQGYRDGYRKTSPVRSFRANILGLYDVGGNAAEWINDFYDASAGGRKLSRDPTGPKSGRFHVIRGSSWRHGSITELRLSFRDYSDEKRNDIGFRIARYVQIPN